MLDKRFLLLLLLLLPVASAVDVTDTLFINTITNFSAYIDATVTFDSVSVTDSGRIEFYMLNTQSTIGKFENINATYISVIDIFNLTNALVYYGNGTILTQVFTGNINISMAILSSVTVMNNYIINDTAPPSSGDPINEGGGGSSKINNTLLDPLLIQIENLDKSFIFMSNETILNFVDGDLNITLNEGEFFYIVDYQELLAFNENNGTIAHDLSGNLNNGTLNGPIWVTDGILIILAAIIDFTINPTTGLFTIINNNYFFSWIEIQWSYQGESAARSVGEASLNAILVYTEGSSSQMNVITIAIILILLIGVFVIFWNKFIKGNASRVSQNMNFGA